MVCSSSRLRNVVQRDHLKTMVDSAINRSLELGDSALALAVKELHEESLQDLVAEDLLESLLMQTPTQEQTIELQNRSRAARMRHRAATKAAGTKP